MSNVRAVVKNIMDLKVGDKVAFYGAVFELTTAEIVTWHDGDQVMIANGRWVEGEVNGFFGPGRDWTFKGNKNRSYGVLPA